MAQKESIHENWVSSKHGVNCEYLVEDLSGQFYLPLIHIEPNVYHVPVEVVDETYEVIHNP